MVMIGRLSFPRPFVTEAAALQAFCHPSSPPQFGNERPMNAPFKRVSAERWLDCGKHEAGAPRRKARWEKDMLALLMLGTVAGSLALEWAIRRFGESYVIEWGRAGEMAKAAARPRPERHADGASES